MAFTQAAQGLGALADPDPLPPAPLLERWLLQDPLPTVILLAICAAVGWWWLNRVGRARAGATAGAACLLAAGGVLLLARLVVTERESLAARCTALVNATIDGRDAEVAGFLRSDALASVPQVNIEWSRDELLRRIREGEAHRRGADKADLRWVTSTIDGPTAARTQVRVQARMMDTWLPTTWMISWARNDPASPWQVRRIEAQQIGLSPPR